MTKRPFTKPATTQEEQVALLQKRGMIIDDVQAACFHLQHINYYRLGAYWLPFEVNHATHDFKAGTNFTTVLTLYNFDRELRLLVIDALERIEVSMRTQWTYYMAHNHDNTLVILLHCMDIIAPKHRWRQKLKTLLDNPNVPLAAMDFPENWQTRAIWQGDVILRGTGGALKEKKQQVLAIN
jgi:hypothetical protein